MSVPAVSAQHLAKRYRIGARPGRYRYKTLRDTLAGTLAAPLRQLRGERPAEPPSIWALRDVSFDVQHGEVVGVIGRNGAGKSTLLKVLSRITEPTSGRAVVRGRVGALLEVGTGFHPELTGRENVYLNGAILGMARADIRRRFDEIVAFAEIDQFLDTPVRHYSSGMYMRLAFSVAAHLEPDILVVDEVLAVGDIAFQQKCLGKMESVSSEGRTVFFVSHNMSAVTRLCSRAMLLEGGAIARDSSAAETVSTYLRSVLGSQDSREWDSLDSAPGSSGVKLMAVGVKDADGLPVSVASVGDPLRVALRYHVALPGMRFRCLVALNTQGTCAFTTVQPTEVVHEQAGWYTAEVAIPPHLLAEGDYSVDVTLFASRGVKQRYVKLKDVLVFQVYDPIDGTSARGDYAEGFLGVVRPRLDWTTTRVGPPCGVADTVTGPATADARTAGALSAGP